MSARSTTQSILSIYCVYLSRLEIHHPNQAIRGNYLDHVEMMCAKLFYINCKIVIRNNNSFLQLFTMQQEYLSDCIQSNLCSY